MPSAQLSNSHRVLIGLAGIEPASEDIRYGPKIAVPVLQFHQSDCGTRP